MNSRIKLDLEDFIDVEGDQRNLWTIPATAATLDGERLVVIATHWIGLMGNFVSGCDAKRNGWVIDKNPRYIPPALDLTLGVNTFLTYEFVPKDVPDWCDRTARLTIGMAPSPYQGRLVKDAVRLVVDQLRMATGAEAAIGDSFASSWREIHGQPHVRVVEYNPFNKGDVKRAFATVLETWL